MTQIGLRKHLRPFQVNEAYPLGFARVKHDSYLNEETSREEKKRPITFFNNIYKWFTSSMQIPVDNHLNLMEGEQRGVKAGCSGTTDNLVTDKMLIEDYHHGERDRPAKCYHRCAEWVVQKSGEGDDKHLWKSRKASIEKKKCRKQY